MCKNLFRLTWENADPCIYLLVPYKTTRSSGRLKKIDNRG